MIDKMKRQEDDFRRVFALDGKFIEFAAKNAYDYNTKYTLFTWREAMSLFGEPDADGWRLPTKKEWLALKRDYRYGFDKNAAVIFDNRLWLLAFGGMDKTGGYEKGTAGYYWSSEPMGTEDVGWYYKFMFKDGEKHRFSSKDTRCSVRLVRDVPIEKAFPVLVRTTDKTPTNGFDIYDMRFTADGDFMFAKGDRSFPSLTPTIIIPIGELGLEWHKLTEPIRLDFFDRAKSVLFGESVPTGAPCRPPDGSLVVVDYGSYYDLAIYRWEDKSSVWQTAETHMELPERWAAIPDYLVR